MRTISGCLKTTPTDWLPVTSAIAPPHLRREEANQRWHAKIKDNTLETPLKTAYDSAPTSKRLKSRKPFYLSKKEGFNLMESWTHEWSDKKPHGGDLIEEPVQKLPGFDTANRKTWVAANRIRTRQGRTQDNLHKWGFKDSPLCPKCNNSPQDTDHLVLYCPVTRLEGGYTTVNNCDENFLAWIEEHNLEL